MNPSHRKWQQQKQRFAPDSEWKCYEIVSSAKQLATISWFGDLYLDQFNFSPFYSSFDVYYFWVVCAWLVEKIVGLCRLFHCSGEFIKESMRCFKTEFKKKNNHRLCFRIQFSTWDLPYSMIKWTENHTFLFVCLLVLKLCNMSSKWRRHYF